MIAVLIGAAVVVIAVLAWRIQPTRTYTPDPEDPLDDGSSAPIDRDELERAEREARGWSATATPEDERPEDDWGPGTSSKT
jgi:hypothetical protein